MLSHMHSSEGLDGFSCHRERERNQQEIWREELPPKGEGVGERKSGTLIPLDQPLVAAAALIVFASAHALGPRKCGQAITAAM